MEPNELGIVDAAKTRLVNRGYKYCGISSDIYQFSNDSTKHWKEGHIFHANGMQDLSFEGGRIKALDDNNRRNAVFLVHDTNKAKDVEDMMTRSLNLKHVGILKPCAVGYNSSISKVISVYCGSVLTLEDWIEAQKKKATSTTIPDEVQELIRTGYMAFQTMWLGNCTSDHLADARSYHMMEDTIKIDPLCIRARSHDENNKIPFQEAFGKMIMTYIYPVWKDVELEDFVELLTNPRVRATGDILGHPVLLSPSRRELMYPEYNKVPVRGMRKKYLEEHASPQAGWMDKARAEDPALKSIIDRQARRGGFSLDFRGALHFATVVTSHYHEHFKNTAQGKWGVDMQGHIDSLLRRVIPRLLSRCYNSVYA